MADPPPASDLARRKTELRRALRERRRFFVAQLGTERGRLERALGPELFMRLPGLQVVTFTRAAGAEIDPAFALAVFAAAGRTTALPTILADVGRLEFRAWRPGDPLRPGPHGIDEPDAGPIVQPDAVVLPLLGFDRAGGRLGQGGGYFDRTLAAWPHLRRVGLAWSCQEVEAVPTDALDLPLDAVLTEREWIPMPPSPSR